MCERQMEELKHLEEAAESVDIPMLILFCYTSLIKKAENISHGKQKSAGTYT